MLTNPENSSQPADIFQSPPAGADGGDSPSQLLGAFIDYLRARPTSVDSESTRFDDGGSEPQGVIRGISELGGVPAITLQPQVGCPDRTVLYFHGGGSPTGGGSPLYCTMRDRFFSTCPARDCCRGAGMGRPGRCRHRDDCRGVGVRTFDSSRRLHRLGGR